MARINNDDLRKRLNNYRRSSGLNQAELSRALGVSQPHLSRILSGVVKPGDKLVCRISQFLASRSGADASDRDSWLKRVGVAARRSAAFRKLVSAALEIVEEKSK
ncbi:XRE family transcriptional regulator [Rhodopseudomonas sp. BR0G17]|nr:XRE family transcriptional regulator [Rhodopseudomonas sp. BR0G17]